MHSIKEKVIDGGVIRTMAGHPEGTGLTARRCSLFFISSSIRLTSSGRKVLLAAHRPVNRKILLLASDEVVVSNTAGSKAPMCLSKLGPNAGPEFLTMESIR